MESSGGGAEVALFKVEDAGAKFEFFATVIVNDVDNNVRDGEIFELVEGVGKEDFVIFFVGGENIGAEVGHFDVVEAERSGGGE